MRQVNIVGNHSTIPEFQLIADGENHGISFRLKSARINLAKGKYFVRMDADDIMFLQIEKQISHLENNPDVDVITGSSAVIIDDDNKVVVYPEFNVATYL